jgi:hypothetical protein
MSRTLWSISALPHPLAALQAQIDSAQKEKYALAEEKGRLTLQVDQLRVRLALRLCVVVFFCY